MRMPADELFVEAARDLVRVERSLLARQLRVQRDLQEKIPELVAETRRVAGVESGERLVRLLEQVRAERRMRLLTVPGAAVPRAEPLHDPYHRGDRAKIGERVQRREHEEPRGAGAVALRAGDGARAIGLEERHRVRGGIPRA